MESKPLEIQYISIPYIHRFLDCSIYEIYIKTMDGEQYVIYSRYSYFYKFYNDLLSIKNSQNLNYFIFPPFPSKVFFNTQLSVLTERRILFQNLLRIISLNEDFSKTTIFKNFLNPKIGPNKECTFYMSIILDSHLNKRNSFFTQTETPDYNDDITDISIPSVKLKDGVIFYVFEVKNHFLPDSYNSWKIEKRFSEIFDFYCDLKNELAVECPSLLLKLPEMPPKSGIFENRFSELFIEKRRILIENLFKGMIYLKDFRRLPEFKKFLGL